MKCIVFWSFCVSKIGAYAKKRTSFFFQMPILAVAHNCHGKTKSHGTTNFTHGKTKLTHGKTKLTHDKTKKTSWSAVGQQLLFASEMVNRVTVNKRNGDLRC